ncbi:MAG: ATP-binding protein [Spirulinaceae cyanobacterium]
MKLGLKLTSTSIIVYIAIIFVAFGSLIVFTIFTQNRQGDKLNPPPVELTQEWQYRLGDSPVNENETPIWTLEKEPAQPWQALEVPSKLKISSGENFVWLRTTLPEKTWPYPGLYIRGIPNLLQTYIEDSLSYVYYELNQDGSLQLKEEKWPVIPLGDEFQNKSLFFRVYVGDRQTLKVGFFGSTLIGSQPELVKKFVKQSIDKLILGCLFVFCGFVPLLFALVKGTESLYLSFGILTLVIGIYTISGAELARFLIYNPQLWSFLHYTSFHLIPCIVIIFFEQVFGSGHRNIIRKLWQIQLGYTACVLVLASSGLVAWYYTFYPTQLSGIISAFILIFTALKVKDRDSLEIKLFTAGFTVFLITVIHDILSYVFLSFPWYLSIYPWGMFVFIIFLAFILERRFTEAKKQLQKYAVEMEVKNTALERLDKLKDDFLANTSHELRTPLNGIIGLAESLVDGVTGKLPNQTLFNLSLIISSGKRLTQLVNDLLDFSRLKHQNIQLQLKNIGMREIAEVVLTISRSLVGDRDIQLINKISPDLPLVIADENRVQQILFNLVGNAIKFSESGTVEVKAKVTEQYLSIAVTDKGIGIPANKLNRIFQPFEQANGSISRQYGGTGLGLAVTKQLVELHQGEIEVRSVLGEGSRFVFTLPLATELEDREDRQTEVSIPQDLSEISGLLINNDQEEIADSEIIVQPSPGKFKVLIVDDEQVNRQVLINYLSLHNYAITQATNGPETLDLINEGFKPDIILLDVMMPKITGYEVCQQIRQTYSPAELPIILLTAKNQVSDLVEGFLYGANDYMAKPISKNELLARMKTHIQLAKINLATSRFVPYEFLEFLGKESISDVNLGDQVQQEMTILFSDIRSFTTISERMSPKENFDFLNAYLSKVGPVIRNHRGFIDKYIGDAIMALFPESSDDALQAAMAMQRQVEIYNEESISKGYPRINIGIGLHTGTLMLGTIGEEERMESTVISDAVNLASRLEGLTKSYGASLLVSEYTIFNIEEPEKYASRFLGRVRVKGKREPVGVFEIYEADPEPLKELKTKTRASFEQAVIFYYQEQFAQAWYAFKALLQQNSQDLVLQSYVKRCERILRHKGEETF